MARNKEGKSQKAAITILLLVLSGITGLGASLLWRQLKGRESSHSVLQQLVEKYVTAEQFDEAFKVLNQALQKDPDNEKLQEILENTLAKKQQHDRRQARERSQADNLIDDLLQQNAELQNRTAAILQQLKEQKNQTAAPETPKQQNQESRGADKPPIDEPTMAKDNSPMAELKEAEKAYRQTLAAEQTEALAGLAQNLDQQEQAIDASHKAKVEPFDSELAYLRGLAQYRLGRYQDAAESFSEYLQSGGENLRGYYGLGLSYRQLARAQEARETFQNAVAKGLEHAATYWELARLELELGKAQEALKYVDKALDLKKDDSRYLQTKGAILFRAKRYSEAAASYTQADKFAVEDSQRAQVNYNLGLSYYNSAQYTPAEKAFERALALDDSQPEYILGLADAQIALGKSEAAQKMLAAAEKKFPSNIDLLLTQGNIYLKAKEYEPALASFQKAYGQNPENRRIINNLGLVYMNLEQFDQSRDFFRRAISRDPNNSSLWLNLALVEVATEQHDAAIRNLEKTIALDPQMSKAYYLLAKEYFASSRHSEAQNTLAQLRRVDPEYPQLAELETLLVR